MRLFITVYFEANGEVSSSVPATELVVTGPEDCFSNLINNNTLSNLVHEAMNRYYAETAGKERNDE